MITKQQKYKSIRMQTDEWKEVVAFSARLRDKLGVKVSIVDAVNYAITKTNEQLDKEDK